MQSALLQIENLSVSAGEKTILEHLNLTIRPGELHVLMGPNGAGKSTLASAIMGDPRYAVTDGTIRFDGEDITESAADVRAKKGIFLSFQSPEEIPGITLENFLRTSIRAVTGKPLKVIAFGKELKKQMEGLDMDPSYAERYLNVGFSGGEKKKAEILQMLMLNPKFAILDETDSGLDVDAVRTVSKGIEEYHKRSDGALLIITHSTKILESLKVDYTHVLVKGTLVTTGGADLVDKINDQGFEKYIEQYEKEAEEK